LTHNVISNEIFKDENSTSYLILISIEIIFDTIFIIVTRFDFDEFVQNKENHF
jgi:hypothetical protein